MSKQGSEVPENSAPVADIETSSDEASKDDEMIEESAQPSSQVQQQLETPAAVEQRIPTPQHQPAPSVMPTIIQPITDHPPSAIEAATAPAESSSDPSTAQIEPAIAQRQKVISTTIILQLYLTY